MSKSIPVEFPGGVGVEAVVGGHRIRTDQPVSLGGEDRDPSPFQLFLGSLATCGGYFALQFCRQRDLPTEGLALVVRPEWDPAAHRVRRVDFELTLPPDFPAKYRPAVLRAIAQCTVKRALLDPPEMEVTLNVPTGAPV